MPSAGSTAATPTKVSAMPYAHADPSVIELTVMADDDDDDDDDDEDDDQDVQN